jgi:hypothetical protein
MFTVTERHVNTPVGQVALQRLSDLTPDDFDNVLFRSEAYRARNQEEEAWMMYEFLYQQAYRERYGREDK